MYEILRLRQGQPIQHYSVFLSHSSDDKPIVRRVHDALQKQGIRCWLDEKQLFPGDDLRYHIDRGVKLWDKLIIFCSKASLSQSSWVETEIDTALEKETRLQRERGERLSLLIPLDLDGYLLQDYQGNTE